MAKNLLSDIITSKTRVKLLTFFFQQPTEMFYVRQLSRQLKDEINAVRRELARFEQAKLLTKQVRGNRTFYRLNQVHPLYFPLQSIVAKSSGLGLDIIRARRRLGQIKIAFISRRLLNNQAYSADLIDVGFIGKLVIPEVDRLIKTYEQRLEREINYTVLSKQELKVLANKRDPFTLRLIMEPKVIIIGQEADLVYGIQNQQETSQSS